MMWSTKLVDGHTYDNRRLVAGRTYSLLHVGRLYPSNSTPLLGFVLDLLHNLFLPLCRFWQIQRVGSKDFCVNWYTTVCTRMTILIWVNVICVTMIINELSVLQYLERRYSSKAVRVIGSTLSITNAVCSAIPARLQCTLCPEKRPPFYFLNNSVKK